MTKRKVKVRLEDLEETDVTAAGRTIAEGAPSDILPSGEGADVDLEAKKIKKGRVVVAGQDVLSYQQVSEPLDELAKLLAAALTKDQADDLHEIIADIKAQAQKPEEERSQPKLKRLLGNIASYISLASLAVTQAGQVQQLFETVKGLLRIG
jgi:hypothetical protein